MFRVEDFNEALKNHLFIADYNWVQHALVRNQVKQGFLFQGDTINRLDYFVEAILSSCVDWNGNEGSDLCRIGAEISEILSKNENIEQFLRKKYRFKASVLYEHAGLPALSQAALDFDDYAPGIIDFFKRKNGFQKLGIGQQNDTTSAVTSHNHHLISLEDFFLQDSIALLNYEQGT